MSRRVVEWIQRFDSPATVFEDLKDMRDDIEYGTRMNRRLHSLPFAKLRDFITYKAAWCGIPSDDVDPEYTSQQCPVCGHTERTNRHKKRFKCRECEHQDYIDRGAGISVAQKWLRTQEGKNVPALNTLPQVRKWELRRQASGPVDGPTVAMTVNSDNDPYGFKLRQPDNHPLYPVGNNDNRYIHTGTTVVVSSMEQRSRRSVLATIAAGTVTTAGCLGGSERVRVLSAGSLAVALDAVGGEFTDQTGIQFEGEFHGANIVMQLIEDGTRHPDVAISADVGLLRDRLYPEFTDWDLTFAANEVGFAYNPDTDLGGRLEDGEPWYELLRSAEEGAVAISEPDLDPLGYRAVHMLTLAEERYDEPGLTDDVLQNVYREPDEPRLLTGIETGDRAIAISYRNMAVDHELPFYELPAELNFANPELEDHYASVEYTTDDGYTAAGSPMAYNATVLADADNPEHGREFLSALTEYPLEERGLTVPDAFPELTGDPPAAFDH